MPKASNEQKAMMDILDFIHFNNVYTSQFLSNEDRNIYEMVISDVLEAVKKIEMEVSIKDAVVHYFLCGLEIALSGDDIKYIDTSRENDNVSDEVLDAVLKRKKEILFAFISCMVSDYGVDKDSFINNLNDLIKKYDEVNIPATVSFRLAVNVNSIIHPLDHLHFYRYVNYVGIAKCAKIHENSNDEISENAFLRVGLIMEFEIFRNYAYHCINPGRMNEITIKIPAKDVSDEVRRQLIDSYIHLIESVASNHGVLFNFKSINSNNEKKVLILLKNVSDFFRHKRIFHGTIAKWPGTWGAFLMELLKQEDPRRAIYCESDNSNCVSEKASEIMSDLKFTVSARTLYLRYSSFQRKELKVIRNYRTLLSQVPYTPSWDGENYIYKIAVSTLQAIE
ncbi:hypothetical protein M8B99_12515 [Enterobacter hormaechei subsp. hoffmannii]|uniref:hypothetical protein n=1 Tax=Enterobacteriaceae TaxID=543 RepID=UPI002236285B|nr:MULTISPECIES: hypothetical protein [Enterobacteriaceae]MCW4713065.1 hypothetical protein [Enterobacter hormaechei subsp. hoffmannii]MEC4401004.1 hypothetical protein [Klebsiella pneumoniae]HCM9400696.1 hypothetical protein [Enterobacter hormaechei subsp. steigerwaltii]HDO6809386.1 hypothetical protein [Klebsiella pneumoniae]